MLDYIVVDVPFQFPQACVGCMSQKGPMVDTHRELPGYGHVYVCKRCAKFVSSLLGFAPGKDLDILEKAVEARAADRRELALKDEALEELGGVLTHLRAETKALKEEKELLVTRVRQLEGTLREEAERSLAVVGGS